MNRHVVIIGSGLVGLIAGYTLKNVGFEVTFVEKNSLPGRGTSWAAAGMLAPIHELDFTEKELFELGQTALRLYQNKWFHELGDLGLVDKGTLELALTVDDVPYLERQFEFQKKLGLDAVWFSGHDLQQFDSLISQEIPAGIFVKTDVQIDNRKFITVLIDAIKSKGGTFICNFEVTNYNYTHEFLRLCNAQGDSLRFSSQTILLFANGYSPHMNLPELPQVYPVKGQMLSIQPISEGCGYTIRIRSRTYGNGYIVPKVDRWVIGSTTEEQGSFDSLTFGGVMDVLRRAYYCYPALYEQPIIEFWIGFRPATFERFPFIKRVSEGFPVYAVNGLYRHGILLAPLLGERVAHLIIEDCQL